MPLTVRFGESLYDQGGPMPYVYFPESCLVSLVMGDEHSSAEVACVGKRGFVGVALALGVGTSPFRALVCAEGGCRRMTSSHFRAAMQQHPEFAGLLYRYANKLIVEICEWTAIDRRQPMKVRLAHWLLRTSDGLGRAELKVSQQFISEMLGMRRSGVSAAAALLQESKLISYSRGVIRILDHAGLVAASQFRHDES